VLARPILKLTPIRFSPIIVDGVAERIHLQSTGTTMRVDSIIPK
jgi:hypothetical protein